VNGTARMKISHETTKISIPGKKEAFRLYNAAGESILDLLIQCGTTPPVPFKKILCRHPFESNKRAYVIPSRVEALHICVWDGQLTRPFPSLLDIKNRIQDQLNNFRSDHLRRLNPTPYKLSVSSDLYTFMHDLLLSEMPIAELK
jgi:nicotinate phosphoribosyltransferase